MKPTTVKAIASKNGCSSKCSGKCSSSVIKGRGWRPLVRR